MNNQAMTSLILSPEFERLTGEIYRLRNIIVELLIEKNELIYKKRPEMQELYVRSIGNLEDELHELKLESIRLKYITDMIRIRIQFRRKVNIDEIEKRADENYAVNFHKSAEHGKSNEKKEDFEPGKIYEDEEIRIIYRRIIKMLHPDIGMVDNDAGEKLLKDAIEAYEYKDIPVLKSIAAALDELGSDTHTPGQGDDIFNALKRKIERLNEKKKSIEDSIKFLKSEFPLNQEQLLSDPVKVSKKQKKLESGISSEKEKVKKLQNKLKDYKRRERVEVDNVAELKYYEMTE